MGGADHAIIPIMLGDAKVAAEFAERALAKGIYVIGFSFPVVPKGQARIRTQMSAAHSREQLDKAIDASLKWVVIWDLFNYENQSTFKTETRAGHLDERSGHA